MSDVPPEEQISTLADLEAFLRPRGLRLMVRSAADGVKWRATICQSIFAHLDTDIPEFVSVEHEDFVTAIRMSIAEALKQLREEAH